jgi:hypothetical protein
MAYTVTAGGSAMALTGAFVRNVKSRKPTTQKHTDFDSLYLLVTPTSKYWRMDYRHLGKRKTIALGVYPAVTLARARARCADARRMIAEGLDPVQARYEEKQDEIFAATQTFKVVARLWMEKTAASRTETTRPKVTAWLENDVFPYIGRTPVSTLKPRDMLVCLQHIEARGVHESAHRVKQICGQVLRFAVANGLTERDVTADLKGALTVLSRQLIRDHRPQTGRRFYARHLRGYQGNSTRPPHSNCLPSCSCVLVSCVMPNGAKLISMTPCGGYPVRR